MLFVAVAFATTAAFAALTLGAIAAVETSGSRSLAGVPAAAAIFGTAAGALFLGALMERHGRRRGLRTGWMVAIFGAALGAVATELGSFALIVPAMFTIGIGNGSSQLARYAAAETVSSERRGAAVGWFVWASAVGAGVGPLAIGPVGRLATDWGLESSTGGFLFAACALTGAALTSLRLPTFATAAVQPETNADPSVEAAEAAAASAALARGRIRLGVAGLIVAQVSMVGVMTVTPVHLTGGGHSYSVVGMVMSSHFIGMFAFAPLVGALVSRLGANWTMSLGLLVLAVGSLSAGGLPLEHGVLLALPLMTIGVGWCMCFVSLTAIAASELPLAGRARAQGRIDSLIWVFSAVGSLSAGLALEATGFSALAVAVAVGGIASMLCYTSVGRAAADRPAV